MTGSRQGRLATFAVALGVVGVHLWLSAPLPGPSLLWDGTAYLSVARWLAGETTPYLGHLGHYGVGYPVVLVPVVWITSSLDGLFDGVRVVNAIAVATTVPALVLLGTRLGGLERSAALALAAAAALVPAVAVQSGFEWAESVFLASVTWTAVAALLWAERPSAPRSVVLALASAGTYLVHPRGLAVAVATVVVLALSRRRGVVGLVVLLIALGGAWLLDQRAIDALWNPAVVGQWRTVADTVTTPSAWGDAALGGLGQLWYALVATVGLVTFGVLLLARLARVRPVTGRALAAWWVIVAMIATLGVSVTKLAAATRPDQLVYGRYVDPWLPLLMVLGAGAIIASSRTRNLGSAAISLAGAGILAIVVVTSHGAHAFEGVFLPLNVLGVLAFNPSTDARIDVVAITAGALVTGVAITAAIALFRRRPALLGVALVVGAVAASASVADRHVAAFAADANTSFVLGEVLDLVDQDAPVALDLAFFDARGSNRYSLADRDRRFTFYDSRLDDVPPHDLVIAGKDQAHPPAPGARVVFPEPRREQTLWVLAGPLQDRLAVDGFLIGLPGTVPGPGFGNGEVELVEVRGRTVVVRVAKGNGGAPWVAPGTLPAASGEVEVVVTVAGRTTRAPLLRTLVPGDEEEMTVPLRDSPTGVRTVRVRLSSGGLLAMPDDVGSLRFP